MSNEVLDAYGINSFPRYFGYPSQILVKNLNDLKRQMRVHYNRDPLYVSHNVHNKEFTIYSQMFFDFDAHENRSVEEMQKALKDCRKFVEEHKKTDLTLTFTGGGFHALLKFQPKTVKMAEISSRIRGYAKYVMDNLGLKTMDLRVAEPGRLFRIPLSPYVYNEGGIHIPTEYFDIPIDFDMLFNYDVEDFLYFSKEKKYAIQEQTGKRLPISFLEPYEMKEEYYDVEIKAGDIDFYTFDLDYFKSQINNIFNDIKLINSLLSTHPSHTSNLIACLKLKDAGFSYNSACSFFERLSEIAKWDNRDLSIQRYQIKTIYESNYRMRVRRV